MTCTASDDEFEKKNVSLNCHDEKKNAKEPKMRTSIELTRSFDLAIRIQSQPKITDNPKIT